MHKITISENDAVDLKESVEWYMWSFGGKKGDGGYCQYNLTHKIEKETNPKVFLLI